MPNTLDENGLQIKTVSEITTDLIEGDGTQPGFKDIYGNDINTDPDTPDGQAINIFAQAVRDVLELVDQVYSSFDPDQAIGRSLDARVGINGITRKGGTFTIQPVELIVSAPVTLEGLDADVNDVNGTGYTLSDDSGEDFILVDTVSLPAGTHVVDFRAKNIGVVETTPNTITNQVTVILGVDSVNNPAGATTTGQDEESDVDLKTRRSISQSVAAQGNLDGMAAAIADLDGVSQVIALENDTSSTDVDGIPGHSIWVIVEGGADEEIADVIYKKKTDGAGMKGADTVEIDRVFGDTVEIRFDRPILEDLYIRFKVEPIVVGDTFDLTFIKNELVSRYILNIDEASNITEIDCILKEIEPGAFYPDLEVSLDGVIWNDIEYPTLRNNRLIVDFSRITIL